MSGRMAVVLSQSATAEAGRRTLEEDLIAALIAEPGVDVHLIPSLDELEAGSTGLLCLEGIAGGLVLLGWSAPETAMANLAARGVTGRRGETKARGGEPLAAADVAADPAAARTVYCLDLHEHATVERCLQEIRRIRRDDAARLPAMPVLAPPPTWPQRREHLNIPNRTPLPADEAVTDADRDVRADDERTLDRLLDELERFDL